MHRPRCQILIFLIFVVIVVCMCVCVLSLCIFVAGFRCFLGGGGGEGGERGIFVFVWKRAEDVLQSSM